MFFYDLKYNILCLFIYALTKYKLRSWSWIAEAQNPLNTNPPNKLIQNY